MTGDTIARALAAQAAITTAADRSQTALDRIATNADRVQTGIDRTAAAGSATSAAVAQALLNGRIFPSGTATNPLPAAVTSVVAEGDLFIIQAASGASSFGRVWRRGTTAGGNATLGVDQGQDLLNKAALDLAASIVSIITDGIRRVIFKDASGYALMYVDSTGIHEPNFDLLKAQVAATLPLLSYIGAKSAQRPGLAMLDNADFAGAWIDKDRLRQPDVDRTRRQAHRARRDTRSLTRLTYDQASALAAVNHILIYGQSPSVATNAYPALNFGMILPWAKRFEGGLRSSIDFPVYGGSARASLVGLNESTTVVSAQNYGETFAMGAALMIQQLLLEEDGLDIALLGSQFLFSAPGAGSKSVAELSDPSTYFTALKADILAGHDLTVAAGNSYLAKAMLIAQCEQDMSLGTTAAAWKAGWLAVQASVQAYQLTISGASTPVPMIFYQNATHTAHSRPPTLPMAQVAIAEENDYCSLASPTYILDFAIGEHYTNTSSRLLGAYYGIHLKRWLFDRTKPRHLSVGTPVWMDKSVILPIGDAIGRLVLDTSRVSDPGNYGFALVDSGGAALTIGRVTLTANNGIQVTSPNAIPSGAQLRYAWGTDGSTTLGVAGGARGCVRDSQGTDITFAQGGDFPMHKYLPINGWTKP